MARSTPFDLPEPVQMGIDVDVEKAKLSNYIKRQLRELLDAQLYGKDELARKVSRRLQDQFVPGLRTKDGKVIPGKDGDWHSRIQYRHGLTPKTSETGFVHKKTGIFLDRVSREAGGLDSTDLMEDWQRQTYDAARRGDFPSSYEKNMRKALLKEKQTTFDKTMRPSLRAAKAERRAVQFKDIIPRNNSTLDRAVRELEELMGIKSSPLSSETRAALEHGQGTHPSYLDKPEVRTNSLERRARAELVKPSNAPLSVAEDATKAGRITKRSMKQVLREQGPDRLMAMLKKNPGMFGRASGLLSGPVMSIADQIYEASGMPPLFASRPQQQGFGTRFRPNPAATQGFGAYTTGVDYVRQKALRDRLTVLRQSGPETYHRIFGENPGTLFPPPYIRETFGPPGST